MHDHAILQSLHFFLIESIPFRSPNSKGRSKTENDICQWRCEPNLHSLRTKYPISALVQMGAKTLHAPASGHEKGIQQWRCMEQHSCA